MTSAPSTPVVDKNPITPGVGGPIGQGGDPAAMAVRRGAQLIQYEKELRNIGQFYKFYEQESGAPTLEGFLAYIMREGRNEYQGLKDGRYVLIPTRNPTSNTVLCHEKDADYVGNRLVLMGDGSVKKMNNADFQAALKR